MGVEASIAQDIEGGFGNHTPIPATEIRMPAKKIPQQRVSRAVQGEHNTERLLKLLGRHAGEDADSPAGACGKRKLLGRRLAARFAARRSAPVGR
jgi:hypothetical protein